MKVCIVGASGKLGQYMVQHASDRGYEVAGVCREQSVGRLDAYKGRITVIPGATKYAAAVKRAVAGAPRESWAATTTAAARARGWSALAIVGTTLAAAGLAITRCWPFRRPSAAAPSS